MLNLLGVLKAPSTTKNHDEPRLMHVDLQQILLDMQRFGKPSIYCHRDNKWSCHIDVSVSPTGAKFEVRSDFDRETPIAAATQCNERLISAISSLGGKTK